MEAEYKHIEAFHRLKLNEEFQHIVTWLKTELARTDTSNRVTIDPAPMFRGQGKALFIQALLDDIENARDIINP